MLQLRRMPTEEGSQVQEDSTGLREISSQTILKKWLVDNQKG